MNTLNSVSKKSEAKQQVFPNRELALNVCLRKNGFGCDESGRSGYTNRMRPAVRFLRPGQPRVHLG
jgi:hypothetical protein